VRTEEEIRKRIERLKKALKEDVRQWHWGASHTDGEICGLEWVFKK